MDITCGDRLTPAERTYVEALAALGDGPVSGADVARTSNGLMTKTFAIREASR